MINESNFIVRESGKKQGRFYIDYAGAYKLSQISKITGIEISVLKEKYLKGDAEYCPELDVYYFDCADKAKQVISEILFGMQESGRGKLIFFTVQEIEYMRMALINEGAANYHIDNKTKDRIFNKLNN